MLAVSLVAIVLLSLLAVPTAAVGVQADGSAASVDGGENVATGPPGNGGAAPNEPSSSGSSGNGGGSEKTSSSSGSGPSDRGTSTGAGTSNGGGNSGDAGTSAASDESTDSGKTAGPADPGKSSDARAGGNQERGSPGDDSERGPPGSEDERGPPPRAGDEARNGGPSVEVSTGSPDLPGSGRPSEAAAGRSAGSSPSSVVDVSVNGARTGDDVDLDVSPPAVEDDAVAFEGISVTVKRDGDFTMRVTNSRNRLAGSPAFEPEEAAEALGRVRLDHSITNEEVEDVSYTFRVSKERLRGAGTGAEQVALYRYSDGEWSELPTDVVGETETHYLLTSESPGMSEFAVGAKRPDFATHRVEADASSVDAGTTLTVSGRVTNHGGADGVYDARLVVDGETVAVKSVTVAAGGTRQVNFRTTLDRPGSRRISINGVAAGEVTVTDGERRMDSSDASVDQALAVAIDRVLDVGRVLGVSRPASADGG